MKARIAKGVGVFLFSFAWLMFAGTQESVACPYAVTNNWVRCFECPDMSGASATIVNSTTVSCPWNLPYTSSVGFVVQYYDEYNKVVGTVFTRTGVPQLSLLPSKGGVAVDDTPMAFPASKGPGFAFQMHYAVADGRDRTNHTWRCGYKWSQVYETEIRQDGATYRLADGTGNGPSFTWDGTNFTEETSIGYQNVMALQWEGSNLVAYSLKPRFSGQAGGGGCSAGTCGGGGGAGSLAAAWHASQGMLYEPDPNGANRFRLCEVTGQDGEKLHVYYDSNSAITSIVDAVGNTFAFAYSGSGYVTNIHDVTGNRDVNFEYSNDCLVSVTDMGGQTFKYGYDNDGRMTSLKRPNLTGYDETTISYDGVQSGGAYKTTITSPEGHSTYMHWAWGGGMLDNSSGLGNSTRIFESYSWGKTPVEETDPEGRVTSYQYYDNTNAIILGKIKKQVNPDGTAVEYDYDAQGLVSEVRRYDSEQDLQTRTVMQRDYFAGTSIPRADTNEVFDVQSVLLSRSTRSYECADQGTSNKFDDVYTLVSTKSWTTTSQYSETRYVFDTNTWLLSEAQELTVGTNNFKTVKTFTFNTNRQLVAIADALTNITAQAFDSVGRLSATYRTNSAAVLTNLVFYDNLDRITNVVYPDGASESWVHAPCGCGILTHIDRGGNITSNSFNKDKLLKQVTVTSPNATQLSKVQYKYNSNRQITNTIDALGNVRASLYDSAGDLVTSRDELGRETHYLHDSQGRQYKTIAADGSVSSNTFDSAGRLIKISSFASTNSGTTLTFGLFSYDSAGRQVATEDALGHVISNQFDMAGRTIKTTFDDGSYTRTEFDLLGRAILQIGRVTNASDEAVNTTSNSFDVLDRVVTVTDPEGLQSRYVYDLDWPSQVKYVVDDSGSTNQASYFDPFTGRLLTSVVYGVQTAYQYSQAGQLLKTTFADGSFTTNIYDGSRLTATIGRTGNETSYGFDFLGRQTSVTNSRGNVSSFQFDQAGNMTTSVDPLSNTNLFEFDSMNRQVRAIRPDGSASTNNFDALGRQESRTGAGSVPVHYEYSALSELTALVDGESNRTEFSYGCFGQLEKKTYADGSSYNYTYTPQLWLQTRIDPKGDSTIYGYNNVGQLTNVAYASDTDVVFQFDNLGRLTQRVDAAGIWSWAYDGSSSRMLSETLHSLGEGGPTSVVNYSYHPLTKELASVSFGSYTTAYSWASGRLTNISAFAPSANLVFSYSYLEDSDLLSTLSLQPSASTTVTVHRTYDSADRLLSITSSVPSVSSVVNSFQYTLDSVGRRTARADADGSSTAWKYDFYDQLTNAARSGSPNGAADAAYTFGYRFDEVGNRLHEDRGQQDLDGTFNVLNQLTALDWAGKLGVLGSVGSTGVVVKVAGSTAAMFNETNYLGGAKMKAGSNSIPIVAWNGTNATEVNRTAYMPPQKPQEFQWDASGNLTNDGMRAFYWNEENKLVGVETLPGVPGLARKCSEFVFDAQSRMVQRRDFSGWTGSNYTTTNVTIYVRDGYRVLAEISGGVTNYHVWGLDLSQSLDGAGGIGGLLARSSATSTWLYTYCGNGNVQDVLDSSGSVVAHYDYDPFGRIVAQSGPSASVNPWRFSTKLYDATWGLSLYEVRVYSPTLHIWPSRDPIGEEAFLRQFLTRITFPLKGSQRGRAEKEFRNSLQVRSNAANLYTCLGNGSVNAIDPLGLYGNPVCGPDGCVYPPDPCWGNCPDYPDPNPEPGLICALRVLSQWYGSMRDADTIGADKWFHCMGACRASRDCGNASLVDVLLRLRELTDLVRNRFDFSDDAISALEQAADSLADMGANYAGIRCPEDNTCECCCSPYVVNGLDPADWR